MSTSETKPAQTKSTSIDDVPRPLRKDAVRNRQRILEAASEVFATRGLNVTLDDIADHAGVGVGTVYRRFPSKDDLIDALFEDRLAEMVATFELGLSNPDPWEGFVTALTGAVEQLSANQGLSQLLLTDQNNSHAERCRDQFRPLGQQLVERAQRTGELREDLQGTDLPMIMTMLGTVAHLARELDPEVWRRFLTITIDGLRTRREAPTPLPRPALDSGQIHAALSKAGCQR